MVGFDQRCAEFCRPDHAYRYPLTTQGGAPNGPHLARVDNGSVARAAAQVAVQASLEVVGCRGHVPLLGLPQDTVHRDGEARRAVPALRRVEGSEAVCVRYTELGSDFLSRRGEGMSCSASTHGSLATGTPGRLLQCLAP